MKSYASFILFLFIGIIVCPNSSQAQTEKSPILLILDSSGSMWGQIKGRSKKDIAQDVISAAVGKLSPDQGIGLMAYGHRQKQDCDDVQMIIDLTNKSKQKVVEAIVNIVPLGRTPLARSATLAIDALRSSGLKATIILVTDGIESCDGEICDVINQAKNEGIDFKLHIVGFGLKEGEESQLLCAAQAGDGKYYDAADSEQLSAVLEEATAATIDDPDKNFTVFVVKNNKPVDTWVRAYTKGTKDVVALTRTYRDTGRIYLEPGIYDMDVRPLEGTDISGTTIEISVGEGMPMHRTVSFDAGKLEVLVTNNDKGWDATVHMYEKSSKKSVASVRTYGLRQSMEVNPGVYDVKFVPLGIKGNKIESTIEDVVIEAGFTGELVQNFETGIALIGLKTVSDELVDATVNIRSTADQKNVVGGRTYTSSSSNPKEFILIPGKYSVTMRSLGKFKGFSESFEIEVIAGQTVRKIIIHK